MRRDTGIFISGETYRKLQTLADVAGTKAADVLAALVDREYQALLSRVADGTNDPPPGEEPS